ncbi:MAG: hypothetical protein HZB16_00115 [Armatimonadetes bacterium]|nr:hypothetical protein [Armatimonadota bacterium]
MNCLQCREQMAEAPNDEARAHLAECPACTNAWNEHLAKHVLAPAAARDWAPPAELLGQVMAALPQAPADPVTLAFGPEGLARPRRLLLPLAAVFAAICLPRLSGLSLDAQAAARSWSQRIAQVLAPSQSR